MRSEPDAEVFQQQLEDSPATRINNVKAVGSYALTIVWEDGHDYGIYNWHYLRALCPCPQDRAKYGSNKINHDAGRTQCLDTKSTKKERCIPS